MTIRTSFYIPVVALALAIALAPATGLARDNNSTDKMDRDEVKVTYQTNTRYENRNSRPCLTAFGRLIAPSRFGTSTTVDHCRLPFGIFKKLFNPGPADVTAPVISNVVISASMDEASVRWTTNERTDSIVYYSTTTPVDRNDDDTAQVRSTTLSLNHQVTLEDLDASTTYYVVIRSRDAAGNITYSDQTSFRTTATTADITAPVISQIIATVGTSTVQVSWKTNEPATSKVYYSTSTPVDTTSSSTLSVSNSSLTTDHTLSIGSLATSTRYYLMIESADEADNKQLSSQFWTQTGF